MDRVAIVEDADSLRDVLKTILESQGYAVDSFASVEEAVGSLQNTTYSCVLADLRLPGKTGIDLLKETRQISRNVPFVLMTAYGSIEIAVEAMKLGASDFICKPFEPADLCGLLKNVIYHRRAIDRSLGTGVRRERSFVTQNVEGQRLLRQSRKVAAVDSSVLILGESGCGKELIAKFIHEHSPRREKPFVAVNCAALPPELLESEFFGHEVGAFTGASQTRIGVFEYAADGTIFLDEIGDMPPALQVKLLRAIQEGEIRRVGSNKTIKARPRIVAATNHDLEESLAAGKMREDFFYRIAVVTLNVPPLRQRKEDIDLLIGYYLDYFCAAAGKKVKLDETAYEMLKTYSWPGNARELENVIERAVVLADEIVTPDHLGIEINLDFSLIEEATMTLTELSEKAAKKAEAEIIGKALARTRGNKSKAAKLLGVSYKTLLNKVKEFQLDPANDPNFWEN